MIFLIDQDFSYSYEELFEEISSKKSYQKILDGKSLKPFFTEFVFAAIHNLPIELVDVQTTNQPIDDAQIIIDNVASPKNLEELMQRFRNSETEVSLYTSGTTGQPKKMVHTLKNLARNVKISEDFKNDVWGFAYNPTHMAGIQVFLQVFSNIGTMVNVFENARTEIFQKLQNHKITHLSATPTFYRLLFPANQSFDHVKRLSIGGEKSSEKLIENITSLFPKAKINNIYASTEAGSLFTSKDDVFSISEKNKDGIRFVDDELYIHKNFLGLSQDIVLEDDFFATGDLVEWLDDEKTQFRFLSRKNEMINVGGYKVNPSEIEDLLIQYPKIKESVVFGKENSVLGNILCAEIVVQEGEDLSENEIRNYLKDHLINYKIPRKISFVETINLTRTGKKSRKK